MAKKKMSREERERALRKLFDELRAQEVPLWPAEFCRRAGIAKTTLHKYPELYQRVSAYGRRTAPHKMCGAGTVTGATARKRGIDNKVRREHERWSRELPRLRERLKARESALTERNQRIEALEERTNRLERCLEALMARAKSAGVSPTQIQKIVNAMAVPAGGAEVVGMIRPPDSVKKADEGKQEG